MKLNYIVPSNDLGGTAVPGCGTIHQSEIPATLTQLSDALELPVDLNNFIIGSTGKREYSGDIDLVIDNRFWSDGILSFRKILEEIFPKTDIARNGAMLHLKYPIVGYDANNNIALPRTGFVQIDFNFGNYEWEKFYHFSDENSAYKGAHRNLIISAICGVNVHYLDDTSQSVWKDNPASITRWKWGQNGFIQVIRHSVKDKHGHWKHKQEDVVIAGPTVDPIVIADTLFPETGYKFGILDSLESIMEAVKDNYGMVDCERIWKQTAQNFKDWNQGKLFKYPSEISKYFITDDK